MKRKKITALISAVLSLILAFVLTFSATTAPAMDSSAINWSAKGSIYITLKHKTFYISDAEFTVYKVASAKDKGGTLGFEYTNAFKRYSQDINDLSESNTPLYLSEFVKENKISGKKGVTDKNGFVKFNQLDLGLYLVRQTKSVKGYSDCTAFLVYIPFEEDGKCLYNVDATPKTDVKKIPDKTTSTTNPGISFSDGDGNSTHLTDHTSDTTRVTVTDPNNPNNPGYDPNDPTDPNNPNNPNSPFYNPTINGTTKPTTKPSDDELIKTGHNQTVIPLLAISGALLFIIGCVLYTGGKKENSD